MRQSFPELRRAAVMVIAVFSLVCAAGLVWLAVRPETIGALSTAHLAGMVALFLLPAATLAAWELDRRAVLRGLNPEADTQQPPRRMHAVQSAARRAMVDAARHRRRVIHSARVGR